MRNTNDDLEFWVGCDSKKSKNEEATYVTVVCFYHIYLNKEWEYDKNTGERVEVIKYRGKGAHVIHRVNKIDLLKIMKTDNKKFGDGENIQLRERLRKETQLSVEVGLYLVDKKLLVKEESEKYFYFRKNGNKFDFYVDIDYNKHPEFKSTELTEWAVGYCESCGFRSRIKPYSFAASYAADHVLRKK